MIGPEQAHKVTFVLAACRGKDLGSGVAGDLYRRDADAAGCTVDENAFAWLELGQLDEGVISSVKSCGDGRGRGKAKLARFGNHRTHGSHGLARE